jgi:hypothetical protein
MTPPPDWGLLIGAVFTFLVLTYLIGDNFLFRLMVYVLIGAGAAYAAVVVIFDVLWPGIQEALARAAARDFSLLIIEAIALLLGILVWFKASPRLAWLGNIPMGYLIGVGAATVLGGAIIGTLGPQIVAAGAPVTSPSGGQPSVIMTIIAATGTIVTLLSFGYYRVGRNSPFQLVNIAGRRFFLMIGLGAIFALVFMASVTLLYDRGATIVDAGREIQRLLSK